MKQESSSFEEKVADLEKLVSKLEKNDLPLESALQIFEEGALIAKDCVEMLATYRSRATELSKEIDALLVRGKETEDE